MSDKSAKKRGQPRPKAVAGPIGEPTPVVVNNYKLTGVYVKGRDANFANQVALDRFNLWVIQHQAEINPAEQSVCVACGTVSYQLCQHHANAPELAAPVVIRPGKSVIRKILEWWSPKPEFDFGVQNNRRTRGFHNRDIKDSEIIPECYNYITANMQTSYAVNGVENRELRLAHSHRLGLRWVEVYDMRDLMVDDTYFKNRLLFTIQRAADTTERRVLFEYTDPESDFGRAWLPIFKILWWVFIASLFILALITGINWWLEDRPQLDEHVVQHCAVMIDRLQSNVLPGNLRISAGIKSQICNGVERIAAQLGLVSKFWNEVVQEFRS